MPNSKSPPSKSAGKNLGIRPLNHEPEPDKTLPGCEAWSDAGALI